MQTNLIVYIKTKDINKFRPLASLNDFIIAPNLMYAALFPYSKLKWLKKWANNLKHILKKNGISLQIRQEKGKVIYKVN